MTLSAEPRSNVKPMPSTDHKAMLLDDAAIEAARHSLDAGSARPRHGPWRTELIKLLNDSLATELWCACCATSATISPLTAWPRP